MARHYRRSRTFTDFQPLPALVLVVLFAAAGHAVRRLFIEPVAIGFACDAGGAPWWCALRQTVGWYWWGGVSDFSAIIFAMLAFWAVQRRRNPNLWAALALLTGGFGLSQYDVTAPVMGLVLTMLVLLRVREQRRRQSA